MTENLLQPAIITKSIKTRENGERVTDSYTVACTLFPSAYRANGKHFNRHGAVLRAIEKAQRTMQLMNSADKVNIHFYETQGKDFSNSTGKRFKGFYMNQPAFLMTCNHMSAPVAKNIVSMFINAFHEPEKTKEHTANESPTTIDSLTTTIQNEMIREIAAAHLKMCYLLDDKISKENEDIRQQINGISEALNDMKQEMKSNALNLKNNIEQIEEQVKDSSNSIQKHINSLISSLINQDIETNETNIIAQSNTKEEEKEIESTPLADTEEINIKQPNRATESFMNQVAAEEEKWIYKFSTDDEGIEFRQNHQEMLMTLHILAIELGLFSPTSHEPDSLCALYLAKDVLDIPTEINIATKDAILIKKRFIKPGGKDTSLWIAKDVKHKIVEHIIEHLNDRSFIHENGDYIKIFPDSIKDRDKYNYRLISANKFYQKLNSINASLISVKLKEKDGLDPNDSKTFIQSTLSQVKTSNIKNVMLA